MRITATTAFNDAALDITARNRVETLEELVAILEAEHQPDMANRVLQQIASNRTMESLRAWLRGQAAHEHARARLFDFEPAKLTCNNSTDSGNSGVHLNGAATPKSCGRQ